MVATLVRLKLRLLLNSFRREVWRVVVLVLGGLYGVAVLAVLVAGALTLADGAVATRQLVAVGAGSLLVLGWALVPLVAFGVDDTLDPQRFALFAVPSRRLAVALVVAGAIGIPGVLTLLAAQLPVLLWAPGSAAAGATAVLGGVLGALTCLLVARVTTTAASSGLRSRRGRDAAGLVGLAALLAVSVLPAVGGTLDVAAIGRWLPGAVAVLAWTPLGAPWAAPGDVADGAPLLALARLAVSAGGVGLLAWAWTRLLAASMVSVGTGRPPARAGRGRGRDLAPVLARVLRLPLPAAAVAARSLRYWRADPRYLGNIGGMAILPILAVVWFSTDLFGAGNLSWAPLAAVPVFAGFAGWTAHNDTAYDSTAFWMHVSAGVRGWHDRLGRVVGAAAWMVPATAVLTLVLAGWSGRWDVVPAALGASLGLLGAGLAVSAVASGVLVYPAPPPGASPFSTTSTGNVGITLVAQAVTSGAAFLLSLPALVTAVLAVAVAPAWGWASLAVGLVGGAGLVAAGVVVGGRALDARADRLLTTMRGWPKH
ncbi:hypothetical protein [Georgenia wangjunii]|uniref:hypothetical protein n=1 Tax=Georgenia wangjunii TaxID=3117730 RepID=UPI002F269C33